MSSSSEAPKLIREVVVDLAAALRILKHCTDNASTVVAGTILGVDINGVLQVTYSFALPQPKGDNDTESDEVDSAQYQMDMMKALRDANIDNNSVGWYQTMNMGTICTADIVSFLYSYQSSEDLSTNSVVLFYDAALSHRGEMVFKAFRLSERFLNLKKSGSTKFIKPADILEELPVSIRSLGFVSAFVRSVEDTHAKEIDCSFESLSMVGAESVVEKHLDTMGSWIDDVVGQQGQFQGYAKSNYKLRQDQLRWLHRRIEDNLEKKEQGEPLLSTRLRDSDLKQMPELGGRHDHLLYLAQIDRYSTQLQGHVATTLQKVALTTEFNA